MSEKKTVSRATMKAIRAMDREQLSEYLQNLYIEGFKAGRKKSTPDDILKAFRQVLISVESIGPTRADAIMRRFSQFFGVSEENAGTPAEEAQTDTEKEGEADDEEEGSASGI